MSGTPAVPGTVGSPGNSGTGYGSSGTSAAGGGLYVTYGSNVTLYNATIAYNASEFGGVGQGVFQNGGNVLAYNSLVGRQRLHRLGSATWASTGYDYFNIRAALGGRLQQSCSGSFPVGIVARRGSMVGNAGLDPTGLQWNGGPTQTIAIVDGSSYAAYWRQGWNRGA